MPELPDIAIYIEALEARILGQDIRDIRVRSPFLVRTVSPSLAEAKGRKVLSLRRIGKRIAIGLDGDFWLVFHLMIAGRLHWRAAGAPLANRSALLALDFDAGTLVLTEAGSKRRASLHVVAGQEALAAQDPGGLEVLDSDLAAFAARLTVANHTLKRALTDPRLFSGIGNAYSDEILHTARLSPVAMTQSLAPESIERLFAATQSVLHDWVARLREEADGKFPEKVTAFRKGMAMHGRFGEPCPDCGAPVQRIRYADNETNYCARCQTGGKILADRSLSRLLKKDWPRTLEELERRSSG
jgi:formamidopyrimidine-DNA glycosylase